MSSETDAGQPTEGKWWAYALLGLAFVVMGFYLLGNSIAASMATAIVIAILLLFAGAGQLIHAFYTKSWGGFFLNVLLAILYAGAGFLLLQNPLVASMTLTFLFGAALIASGIVRIVLAWRYWHLWGWLMLLAGAIAIVAGLVVLLQWPATGLWVLGFVVGVDLVVHGAWWIAYGFAMRRAEGAAAAP